MFIPPTAPQSPPETVKLYEVAQKLEASFVAEMLKHSGLSGQSAAMTSGTGTGQFDSFLIEAQANELVQAGGIGLTESLFNSLLERSDVQND